MLWEIAIETIKAAAPLFDAIGKRDADRKDQALRAANSVALRVAEALGYVGLRGR